MPTPKNSRGGKHNRKKKAYTRRTERKASFYKYALHDLTSWMGALKKIGIEPDARDKALVDECKARTRKSPDIRPGF